MKVPVSWLKEFVDIELLIPELAHRLTLAGLEVEEIRYVGLPLPEGEVDEHTGRQRSIGASVLGLAWDPDKIVVGEFVDIDKPELCEEIAKTKKRISEEK